MEHVKQFENEEIIILTIDDDFIQNPKEQLEKLGEIVKNWNLEWGLVADYRNFKLIMTPEYLNTLINAMRFVKEHGVGKVIRVLTKSQAMFQPVLKNKSKEFANYSGIAVKNIEDAIFILKMAY